MNNHIQMKRVMILLAAMLTLTATASAQSHLALRGKQQIGLEIGALSSNTDAGKDAGDYRFDVSSTGPSFMLRYECWHSEQTAYTIQAGLLDARSDIDVRGHSNGVTVRSASYSVVPVLFGLKYKPDSFETSSRSFFALEVAAGPYIASGNESGNWLAKTKSETVFGGCVGISHNWLLGKNLSLSINARYHLTMDYGNKLAGFENASGFNGSVGLGWIW